MISEGCCLYDGSEVKKVKGDGGRFPPLISVISRVSDFSYSIYEC
jgi:hypothetical protein